MSETAIFYALVSAGPDGTLTPYKGTSVDKVRVSATAVVADFRKAVCKENQTILPGVVAAQLKVFKDLASCASKTPHSNQLMTFQENQSRIIFLYWFQRVCVLNINSRFSAN
jgi:hypothetical protein